MGTISVSLPSDGSTADVSDYNTPINSIVNEINGNLNQSNIAANGVGTAQIADAAVTDTKLAARPSEYLSDFIYSGGVVAQSAGLVGTFSNIVYYIGGVRYTATSVANKTYTASKDTYVDIGSDGTVDYNEVTNGAAAPSLSANHIRVAKVVTSGAAITSVSQYGRENSVQTYPTNPISGHFYKEIARTTLTTAGNTITVSSIPTRKYLMVVYQVVGSGGATGNVSLRLNNDSGANYARRSSVDGAADGTIGSTTAITNASGPSSGTSAAAVIYLTNVLSQEKLAYGHSVVVATAGAASVPTRNELTGKWTNTTSVINRIDLAAPSNNFAAGSEVVVLGSD
jgi:hypothetical protein